MVVHTLGNPADMDELTTRIAMERGPDFDIGSYFNDRRVATRQAFDGPAPVPQQARDATQHGDFRWTIMQDVPFERLIVHVEDVPDGLNVAIFIDTNCISPADGERVPEPRKSRQGLRAAEGCPGGR